MNRGGLNARSKRKQPSISEDGRPFKHPRPLNGKTSPGENTPDVELPDFDLAEAGDDDMVATYQQQPGDTAEWQATIEKVVSNVVSIRFCQTCSFDTDVACASEATGFVVDSEKGYILTNRHVVGAGPFWGYVVFDNHEEVDAYPVYRDPVHDFGILRFDPKAIKYMPVAALTLRPDLAKGW
jgi:S1-C subfamily serine protease